MRVRTHLSGNTSGIKIVTRFYDHIWSEAPRLAICVASVHKEILCMLVISTCCATMRYATHIYIERQLLSVEKGRSYT